MSVCIPFPYFGGKFTKINSIIHLFPVHKTYIEPYAGSLAVFFNKQRSQKEIISDYNKRIFIFFKMLRDFPDELTELCNLTPYNEQEYRHIVKEFQQPFTYEDKTTKELLEVARQVFAGYNMSFSGLNPNRDPGLSFGRTTNKASILKFKKSILLLLANRISKAVILCKKAEYVIDLFKNEEKTFFYLDPPYPETDKNYENEYTPQDFNHLLELLKVIKGKFLLNCYKKDWMNFDPSWDVFEKQFVTSIDKSRFGKKRSTRKECFVLNYKK